MDKILILTNDSLTIYNFRRELLYRLINCNYQVMISVPAHPRNTEFISIGCQVVNSNISRFGTNPIKEIRVFWNYIKLLRKIQPDVVLTYTAKPNIYGSIACQICNVPYINNVTGLGSNFQNETLLKKLMIFLQKKAYKKSRCVFFQNSENKRYFEDHNITRVNAVLLPGSGVNLKIHKLEPYPEELSDRFIIVSRLRKDKGFDELFDAIPEVHRQHPKVEFHIVGWFEEERYLKQLEYMKNNFPVFYHGEQPQEKVHELIANCHCLIHPSWHEGMANVLLEAAATGRPCLTSNINGCKEAVNDGQTGFLFDVKNSKSLEETILKFIKIPYLEKIKMGQKGRNKMESEFDRNFVVNAYLKQIEKIRITKLN